MASNGAAMKNRLRPAATSQTERGTLDLDKGQQLG